MLLVCIEYRRNSVNSVYFGVYFFLRIKSVVVNDLNRQTLLCVRRSFSWCTAQYTGWLVSFSCSLEELIKNELFRV